MSAGLRRKKKKEATRRGEQLGVSHEGATLTSLGASHEGAALTSLGLPPTRFHASSLPRARTNEHTYERLTTSPTNRIFDALVVAPTRPAASPNPYSTDTPPAAQQLSSHSRSPQRGRPALRWRWSTPSPRGRARGTTRGGHVYFRLSICLHCTPRWYETNRIPIRTITEL